METFQHSIVNTMRTIKHLNWKISHKKAFAEPEVTFSSLLYFFKFFHI